MINTHNITSIATRTVKETGVEIPEVMEEGHLIAVDGENYYVALPGYSFLGAPFVKKYSRDQFIVTEKMNY